MRKESRNKKGLPASRPCDPGSGSKIRASSQTYDFNFVDDNNSMSWCITYGYNIPGTPERCTGREKVRLHTTE